MKNVCRIVIEERRITVQKILFPLCLIFLMGSIYPFSGCKQDSISASSPGSSNYSCANFPPPPGESWTYRIVGTTNTISLTTEKVDEIIGNHKVHRIHRSVDPPNLGNYIGCEAGLGKVLVASDWWDINNPSNHGRDIVTPPEPLSLCPLGSPSGTVCRYARSGSQDTVVLEVLSYEDIVVPYDTFRNVQKIRKILYHNGQIDRNLPPTYQWIDASIGMVREQEINSGKTIELIGYNPPGGKSLLRINESFQLDLNVRGWIDARSPKNFLRPLSFGTMEQEKAHSHSIRHQRSKLCIH